MALNDGAGKIALSPDLSTSIFADAVIHRLMHGYFKKSVEKYRFLLT